MITDTTHIVGCPKHLTPQQGPEIAQVQYFLTDVPNTQSWSSQVEDPTSRSPVITIAAIAGEIAAGDGSEEYDYASRTRWEQSILGQMRLYKERADLHPYNDVRYTSR